MALLLHRGWRLGTHGKADTTEEAHIRRSLIIRDAGTAHIRQNSRSNFILHAFPRARARAIPDGKCAVEWKLFRFGPGSATSLSRSPKVELIAGALPQ